jgi:hypothetical protein
VAAAARPGARGDHGGVPPAEAATPAGATRDSFTYLVAEQADLRLINLACGGHLHAAARRVRLRPGNRALDAPDPAGTQLDAAVQALREHEGRVGLVTVVVGGNDLAPCALASDPLACAVRAAADVRANLAAVLPVLREAAGNAQIVGLTCPDVFLGAWVSPAFPDGQNLARLSVPLFRTSTPPSMPSTRRSGRSSSTSQPRPAATGR